MADSDRGGRLARLDGLHWAAVVLAVVTGLIHVYLGVVEGRLPLVIAGVGFFGGVGVFLAGYRGRWFYLAAIAYTAIQVVAWAVVNAGAYTVLGFVDKAVQLLLITVVADLVRRD